ncbi:MAG TPA: RHS repeat-associated core domain-containing protein [Kiritimatiellia bacterium]|nr:RHS repeat-associated core domain-containing protein [Kiritimatiellia bacterium]HMO99238.1 RHS repeat-associated core domain-containing protein [Kiritimatiellia bacterium]HMO99243.1 RHS repeat-associated core domain-containing protein [Kiritimatiellia bacterium]HMP90958.1 RHS repeat-associated core domain-containing protein [Kiritimatiellia bacterium]
MIARKYFSILSFALFAISAFAKNDCDTCKQTSLKPLDLSRAPSHEELILSGQLGGNLAPTGPENRTTPEDRMAFGRAMDAWNRHDYKRAKVLLKQHAAQFRNSPWKAEAELHLGCEARFNGRYAEAEDYFTAILAEHADKQGTADGEVLHRAELRLAMLETMRGDFSAAREKWAAILRNDPDRARRDYARHWLYRVGLYEQNAEFVRRCGTESLSVLLSRIGEDQAAREILALPANPDYGFRADELVTLAREHGVKLNGVRASNTDHLPTPFLAHYDFKHFVAVTGRDADGNVTVFDPILNLETVMTSEEFSREWSGVALVPKEKRGLFAGIWNGVARLWRSPSKDAPLLLAMSALKEFTGGCCGIENPNTDEGGNVPTVGGSRCPKSGNKGLSGWTFAPSSVNIYASDTPLWYEPAIGPDIEFTMSYNAIDADNNLPSFGPKWMFSYHSYAVETPAAGNGTITIFMPDGRNDVYSPISGTNTFTPPGRVFNQLVKLGTNQFTLTMPDGTVYRYGQPVGATNVQQALLTAIEDRHSNTVTLAYDGQPNPKLIAVVDALSQTSRIYYGGSGFITNIVDPFGRGTVVVYSNNYVATVRDMGGVESRYSFYTNGLEKDYVQSMRTDCGEVTFTYALADGKSTGTWDRSTLTATFADGSTEVLFYNGIRKTFFTDRNGHTVEYDIGIGSAFPYQGRINSALFPDGNSAAFKYNAALQVTNITDEANQNWRYAYNDQGRLTALQMPNNYRLDFAYTNGGFDLAKVTEATSIVVAAISYTSKRDVETVTNALNEATYFAYDNLGRLTNIVDALNIETVLAYGPNQWLASVSRAGFTLATYQQDAIGRVTNVIGPENISAGISYDDLNRLTSLNFGDGQPYRWIYETNSLLRTSMSDRTGRRAKFEYDALERTKRVWLPDNSFVSFDYDSADNLTALLDGKGNRTRFARDSRDRLTQKTYPLGDTVSMTYDQRGLPITHTGGRGFISTLKYDAAGLLTNVSYSATNTPGVRYGYNSRNLLVSMADGWSTNTLRYDDLGRLTNMLEVFGASTQTWNYAFDPIGRMTALTWRITGNTNLFRVSYGLDELGRVTNVTGDVGSFNYAYTNAGLQVSQLVYPNGETANYFYDAIGRMTNLVYSTGESWSYDFDSRDFVTRCVDPTNNVFTYAYDEAGRLIEARGVKGTNIVSGYPFHYDYDRAGNRIKQTEGQKQRELLYNANNQLTRSGRTNILSVRGYVNEPGSLVSVRTSAFTNWVPATTRFISHTQAYYEAHNVRTATNLSLVTNTVFVRATDPAGNTSTSTVKVVTTGPASTRFYASDADGNQTFFQEGLNLRTLTWDAENRLIRVDYTNGSSRFRYDGWGRLREIAEHNSVGTLTSLVRYAWNGYLPWAELNSTNGVIRTFTWGLDVSGTVGGAGGIGGLVGIRSYIPGTNYFVRSNGRGNVTEVRRTNGAVVANYSYAPYGQLLTDTGSYSQPFRFQTKLYHGRSGYTAWPLRWYDPQAGRWLSRDLIGEDGGINLFQHVGSNPINLIDPDGRFILEFALGAAAVYGIVDSALKLYNAWLDYKQAELASDYYSDALSANDFERAEKCRSEMISLSADMAANIIQGVPGTSITGMPPGAGPKSPDFMEAGPSSYQLGRPGYNRVKGYTRDDGTHVPSYYRRSEGSTAPYPENDAIRGR